MKACLKRNCFWNLKFIHPYKTKMWHKCSCCLFRLQVKFLFFSISIEFHQPVGIFRVSSPYFSNWFVLKFPELLFSFLYLDSTNLNCLEVVPASTRFPKHNCSNEGRISYKLLLKAICGRFFQTQTCGL